MEWSRCQWPGFNLVIEVLFFSSKKGALRPLFPMQRFNLVIEVLFFSSASQLCIRMLTICFNLVIEVLFFSSLRVTADCLYFEPFQSRNRGSFLFKPSMDTDDPNIRGLFQSRNRGSFLFKYKAKKKHCSSFYTAFQSRNRGSFLFKLDGIAMQASIDRYLGFNLVIEVLFFSRELFETVQSSGIRVSIS